MVVTLHIIDWWCLPECALMWLTQTQAEQTCSVTVLTPQMEVGSVCVCVSFCVWPVSRVCQCVYHAAPSAVCFSVASPLPCLSRCSIVKTDFSALSSSSCLRARGGKAEHQPGCVSVTDATLSCRSALFTILELINNTIPFEFHWSELHYTLYSLYARQLIKKLMTKEEHTSNLM